MAAMNYRMVPGLTTVGSKRVCELCGERVTKKTRLSVGCTNCRPSAAKTENGNAKN